MRTLPAAVAVAASLLLVACTSDSAGSGAKAAELARAGGPVVDAAAVATLRHTIVSSPGPVVIPDGQGMVLYGGSRPHEPTDETLEPDDPAAIDLRLISRVGAFIAPDGSRRTFRTDAALATPSAAVTAEALFLTGRVCDDGTLLATDMGTACSPGTPTLLRVDRSTLVVEEVDLDLPGSADPDAVRAELHRFGDGVVLTHHFGVADRAIFVSHDGTPKELPDPPGVVACSTGDALVAYGNASGGGASMFRLTTGANAWTPIPPPEDGFTRSGYVTCAGRWLIKDSAAGTDDPLAALDDADDRWRTIEVPPGAYVAWTNPRASVVAVSTDAGLRVVDLTSASSTSMTRTSDIGAPIVLTDAGELVALTPDLTLVPAAESPEDPP